MINLDGYTYPEELEEISSVFNTLAAYAKNKARAMRHRIDGDIAYALAEERQCEKYYAALPDWARW